MRTTYKMLAAAWGSLSKYSKFILKYGAVYLVALVTAAQALRITAGSLMDYYSAMDFSDQLIKCLNPSVGVLGLGVILFECAYHAYAEDA